METRKRVEELSKTDGRKSKEDWYEGRLSLVLISDIGPSPCH